MLQTRALGWARGDLKPRTAPIRGVIIHEPGSGLWRRWKRDNNPPNPWSTLSNYDLTTWGWDEWKRRRGQETTPFETALRVYSSIYDNSPHFVVCGETGQVAQCVPVNLGANHCSGTKSSYYRRTSWKATRKWWLERWPALNSPRDFLDGNLWGHGEYAIQNTIGIEVCPRTGGNELPWTDAGWRGLKDLIQLLVQTYHFPFDPHHIITHSDAHPLMRTVKGKPTDVAPEKWSGPCALYRLR